MTELYATSYWSTAKTFQYDVLGIASGFLVGIDLIGILFFGGGVSTSLSEFCYLTLVAGRLQRVYWRLGDHSAQENVLGLAGFP